MLVHGSSADHSRWETVFPLLEPHATVYAVDRRGRGASGDAAVYSLEAEAADIAAVVDTVAAATGGPVDLLGHSYGAQCALEAALLTGGIRRLALYEPAILPDTPDEFVDHLETLQAQGRNEDVVIALLRFVGMPEAALEHSMSLPSWAGRVAAAHTVIREFRAEKAYRWQPERFAALRVPTLLLAGSDSPADLLRPIAALSAALPAARVVTMAGQGHVAMTTAPELFADAVLDFLRASTSVNGYLAP